MACAASGDRNSDVFHCTICLERFTKPKYLPCLHTFCEACLNTYVVSTQSGKDKPVYFPCPVCRLEVKPADLNAPIEEWAKLMPVNHLIHSLMDTSVIEKNGENTTCKPCERDNDGIIATSWCIECQEGLCEKCKKSHKLNKASTKHNLVPLSELDKSDVIIHAPDFDEPCPVHKGEVLKVFCEDHQEMCCVICLSINHRKCEDIKTFDQMAENIGSGNRKLFDKVKEMGTKVKSLVDSKQQNIDGMMTDQQDILKEVSTLVENSKKYLDKCHEEFKFHFCQIHKDQSTKLVDGKSRIESFQKTLMNCEELLKAVLEHGSPKQIFMTSEKIKKQLQIQSDSLMEFLKDDQNIKLNVKMDGKLASITTMTSLAEVEINTKPCNGLSSNTGFLFSTGNEETDLQRQLLFSDVSKLEAVKLFNVINMGGWFTGGTFLDDGRLLFVDTTKRTLNVFHTDGNLQISHTLTYEPWDVVQHSDGRLFVTDETTKSIRTYSLLDKNLNETKSITLPSNPRGISAVSGHVLVVADKQLQVMSLEGELLKTIDVSNTYCSVTASDVLRKESLFYYCDNEVLFCRNINGNEIQKLELPAVKKPRGIALDYAGNAYVCDRESNKVFLISKDFESSRIFLSNVVGIDEPYAMGFDKSGTKFFISDYDKGALAVFELHVKK